MLTVDFTLIFLLLMDALDLADTLHHQADQLMNELRLSEILKPYGSVTPTGSYYLKVMVYPDLDVYLPQLTIEQLFTVGGQLAKHKKVVQVVFEQGDPMMPGGLYLKLRIATMDWERLWKVDLWSLDPDLLKQKMAPMRRFFACLTPELRQKIIQYKLSIITSAGRTPMYSGYYIYKAFIDEGLEDFKQITNYLIENGIPIT